MIRIIATAGAAQLMFMGSVHGAADPDLPSEWSEAKKGFVYSITDAINAENKNPAFSPLSLSLIKFIGQVEMCQNLPDKYKDSLSKDSELKHIAGAYVDKFVDHIKLYAAQILQRRRRGKIPENFGDLALVEAKKLIEEYFNTYLAIGAAAEQMQVQDFDDLMIKFTNDKEHWILNLRGAQPPRRKNSGRDRLNRASSATTTTPKPKPSPEQAKPKPKPKHAFRKGDVVHTNDSNSVNSRRGTVTDATSDIIGVKFDDNQSETEWIPARALSAFVPPKPKAQSRPQPVKRAKENPPLNLLAEYYDHVCDSYSARYDDDKGMWALHGAIATMYDHFTVPAEDAMRVVMSKLLPPFGNNNKNRFRSGDSKAQASAAYDFFMKQDGLFPRDQPNHS